MLYGAQSSTLLPNLLSPFHELSKFTAQWISHAFDQQHKLALACVKVWGGGGLKLLKTIIEDNFLHLFGLSFSFILWFLIFKSTKWEIWIRHSHLHYFFFRKCMFFFLNWSWQNEILQHEIKFNVIVWSRCLDFLYFSLRLRRQLWISLEPMRQNADTKSKFSHQIAHIIIS